MFNVGLIEFGMWRLMHCGAVLDKERLYSQASLTLHLVEFYARATLPLAPLDRCAYAQI